MGTASKTNTHHARQIRDVDDKKRKREARSTRRELFRGNASGKRGSARGRAADDALAMIPACGERLTSAADAPTRRTKGETKILLRWKEKEKNETRGRDADCILLQGTSSFPRSGYAAAAVMLHRTRVHANPSDTFARVISAGYTRLNYTRRHKPALNHCRNLRDLRRPGAVPGNGLRRSVSIA